MAKPRSAWTHPRRQHLLQLPGSQPHTRRNTVIPLATRSARALAGWLSPAYVDAEHRQHVDAEHRQQNAILTLRPDLDQIEALAPEREALWTRLEKASFLTGDEKRAAAGYGPNPQKMNPFHDDRGRFDFKPDGEGEDSLPIPIAYHPHSSGQLHFPPTRPLPLSFAPRAAFLPKGFPKASRLRRGMGQSPISTADRQRPLPPIHQAPPPPTTPRTPLSANTDTHHPCSILAQHHLA